MTYPTTTDFAEELDHVLRVHYQDHGPRETIATALADLHHLADAWGLDFADLQNTARDKYAADVERSGKAQPLDPV